MGRSTAKRIAFIAMMVATIEAAKYTLAFLPNIELTSLLIILYTLYFGADILFAIPVFIVLEGTVYGFGLWWLMYLYAWPLLALLTYLCRHQKSPWFWALLSGSFGLAFGALCSIPYIFIQGIYGAFTWWIAGIPFDVVHCVGNFIMAAVLFRPLSFALQKLLKTTR